MRFEREVSFWITHCDCRARVENCGLCGSKRIQRQSLYAALSCDRARRSVCRRLTVLSCSSVNGSTSCIEAKPDILTFAWSLQCYRLPKMGFLFGLLNRIRARILGSKRGRTWSIDDSKVPCSGHERASLNSKRTSEFQPFLLDVKL